MELQQNNPTGSESGPNIFWIIVKIAVVILIVFLGIKYFSEKKQVTEVDEVEEADSVERKTTKPKSRKKKQYE